MSTKRSFWSSLPGLVTGIAGVVGAGVGLVTVLITLGVIGNSKSSPTPTTVAPTDSSRSDGGVGGGVATTSTTPKGSFVVDTDPVTLSLLKTEQTVKVRNTGTSTLSLNAPQVVGQDRDRFKVDGSGCTGIDLGSGKTCPIKVTLTGVGPASATMVVSADNARASSSVALEAT